MLGSVGLAAFGILPAAVAFTAGVLGYMLVTVTITLVRDGYDTYPTWFVVTCGWALLAAMIAVAAIATAVRWRRPADAVEPWPALADLKERA